VYVEVLKAATSVLKFFMKNRKLYQPNIVLLQFHIRVQLGAYDVVLLLQVSSVSIIYHYFNSGVRRNGMHQL